MNLKFPVGNKPLMVLLIVIFVTLFIFSLARCAKAEAAPLQAVVRAGSSFSGGGAAPVIGIDVRFPQGNAVNLVAGTMLWGQTPAAQNNWDWHAGLQGCRGRFCASLSACYLQRIDAINGSHTNFNLGLTWRIGWKRIDAIDFAHISNAGTTAVNKGRQAALLDVLLQ